MAYQAYCLLCCSLDEGREGGREGEREGGRKEGREGGREGRGEGEREESSHNIYFTSYQLLNLLL